MFWGLTMEPQRRYTQTVVDAFHISQAAIDILSINQESTPTQVVVDFENNTFLLATLSKSGKLYQVPLDLNFQKGDHVSFRTIGPGIIHLTGYHVYDDDDLEERLMAQQEEDTDDEFDEELDATVDDSVLQGGKRKKVSSSGTKNKKSKLESSDDEIDNTLGDSTLDEIVGSSDLGEEEESDDDGDPEEDSDEDLEEEEVEDDSDGDAVEDSDEESEDNVTSSKGKKEITTNGTPATSKKSKEPGKTPKSETKNKANKELNQSHKGTPKAEKTPKSETKKQDGKTPKQEGKTPKKEKNTPGNGQTPGSPQKKVLEGGLISQEVRKGEGAVAKTGKMVQVYYVGRLKSNNKQFDAATNGAGFRFRLGRGEVIRGWDIGIQGMRVGSKRVLTIPAALAYGAKGSPPVIPPNSTLVFEVELRGVS